jgi:hypothetical protein
MSSVMIVLAVGLFLFDFQNLLATWRGRTLGPCARGNDDFTIVVPLYGVPEYSRIASISLAIRRMFSLRSTSANR